MRVDAVRNLIKFCWSSGFLSAAVDGHQVTLPRAHSCMYPSEHAHTLHGGDENQSRKVAGRSESTTKLGADLRHDSMIH